MLVTRRLISFLKIIKWESLIYKYKKTSIFSDNKSD